MKASQSAIRSHRPSTRAIVMSLIALVLVTGCAFWMNKDGAGDDDDTEETHSALGVFAGQGLSSLGPDRLAAGPSDTCMILASGALECWGDGNAYQLGNGRVGSVGDDPNEMGQALSAVKMPTGLSVTAVAPSQISTCALFTDGRVRCWGTNADPSVGAHNLLGLPSSTTVVGDVASELGDGLVPVPLGRSVRQLAAGYYSYCALLDDGTVKCWGQVGSAQDAAPVTVNYARRAVSIAAGVAHHCALLDDGSVECFGLNGSGQLGVGDTANRLPVESLDTDPQGPHSLARVDLGGHTALQVVSGFYHTCARLDDGNVKCWGDNAKGQLGIATTDSYGSGVKPMAQLPIVRLSGATVRSLTAGANHTCAVLNNGRAQCWGDNAFGQLGVGTTTAIYGNTAGTMDSGLPYLSLGTLRSVRSMAAGFGHTCAWLDDGSVKCWGLNNSGQLGIGNSSNRGATAANLGDGMIAAPLREAISAGSTAVNSCSVFDSGALKCWGVNGAGQIGTGSAQATIGDGTGEMGTALPAVAVGRGVVDVKSGLVHTCAALDDGSVKCWGGNSVGQLGRNSTAVGISTPAATGVSWFPRKVVQVAVGYLHTCARFDDGGVKCWGAGPQLGLGLASSDNRGDSTTDEMTPLPDLPLGGSAIAITAGAYHTCVLLSNGGAKCWGTGSSGQLGTGSISDSSVVPSATVNVGGATIEAIGAGSNFTCALLSDATVKCWGANGSGQIGIGSTTNVVAMGAALNAVPLPGAAKALALSVGGAHTCVLTDAGTVQCWGDNSFGQLGTGTTVANVGSAANPVSGLPVAGVSLGTGHSVTGLAAGYQHTCALFSDGSRKCWGDNSGGALGQEDTVQRGKQSTQMGDALPAIHLGVSRPAVFLASGWDHSCAILDSGPVKCWGYNGHGELGDGDTVNRANTAATTFDALPQAQLGLGRSARAIAIGDQHNCALLDDGQIKCWGNNRDGQLGVGDTATRGDGASEMNDNLAAVDLGTGRTAVAVSAGFGHTCAILDTGAVKCWGRNQVGQLGQGDVATRGDSPGELGDSLPPVDLGTGRTARALATADSTTCALLDNGRVKCWGSNKNGALGVGLTVASLGTRKSDMGDALPTLPLGGRAATQISPGCAVLDAAGAGSATNEVWCWGLNTYQQVGITGPTFVAGPVGPLPLGGSAAAVTGAPGPDGTDRAFAAHRCAILMGGGVKCWGSNSSGKLGIGVSTQPVVTPTSVLLPVGRTATQVNVGGNSTCALLDDGTIDCWGLGSNGARGDGTTTTIGSTPASMASMVPVKLGAADTCLNGACSPGPSGCANGTVLTDPNSCMQVACNPDTGARHTPKAAGTACPDGNACNGTEACNGYGACGPGATPTFDDSNPCTADACDPVSGVSHTFLAAGAPCSDGNLCVSGKTCNASHVCNGGTAVTTDDGNPCTADGCSPATGVQHVPLAFGTNCGTGVACDGAGHCAPPPAGPPPPDPSQFATTVPGDLGVPFDKRYDFLYTGPNKIQTMPNGTGITTPPDPERVSVVRGQVLDVNGQPMPSVAVSVLGQPGLGQTLARADGMYDLAVNGGGTVTLNYERAGYFRVQRKIKSRWNEVVRAPDIALTPPDESLDEAGNVRGAIQKCDPSTTSCDTLVVRGRTVSDGAGTRTTTLLLDSSVQATAVTSTGTTSLNSITVRATEYTDDRNDPTRDAGGAAMPGDIPFGIGYTYAAELSIDEAAGATSVVFDKPVPVYIDNYLNIPVGWKVPIGYYDRDKGVWVKSDSGLVVQIVDTAGHLDANAESQLSGQITPAERQKLAALYTTNKTLTRFSTTHFTPFDANFPYTIDQCNPDSSTQGSSPGGPCGGDRVSTVKKPEGSCSREDEEPGSIIECQSGGVGEEVPIAGTPFTLNYRSRRAPGFMADRTIELQVPDQATHEARLSVGAIGWTPGGLTTARHKKILVPDPNQPSGFREDDDPNTLELSFKAADPYGRPGFGMIHANIDVIERYPLIYAPGGGQWGGLPTGVSVQDPRSCKNDDCNTIKVHTYFETSFLTLDTRTAGIGGWTLDAVHQFDRKTGVIELGTGERRKVSALDGLETTKISLQNAPSYFDDMAIGPDGTAYVIMLNLVYKLPRGANALQAVAGNFAGLSNYYLPTDDDVHAAMGHRFSGVSGIALGPDGTVYVTDRGANRVKHIRSDGKIETVVGQGAPTGAGSYVATEDDYQPALTAHLNGPSDVVVADDGTLYIADTSNNRIRRVDTANRISLVAGNGATLPSPAGSADGVLAATGEMPNPSALALGRDGSLYAYCKCAINTHSNGLYYGAVRHITGDGHMATVLGNGGSAVKTPQQLLTGSAPAAQLGRDIYTDVDAGNGTQSLAVDSVGRVFFKANGGDSLAYVDTDGTVHLVAGTPSSSVGQGTERGPATSIPVTPRGFALAPDDTLYVSDEFVPGALRRIAPYGTAGSVSSCTSVVPSADGNELYCFDTNGRHLQTLDAYTQKVLLYFDYTGDQLTAVRDADGNKTQIQWASAGVPSAIISPAGQRTNLYVDADHYLNRIEHPDGTATSAEYQTGGLLKKFTDPRNRVSQFAYDPATGEMIGETLPNGGTQTRDQTLTSQAQVVTFKTPLGRATTHKVNAQLAGSAYQKITTSPDGTLTRISSSADGTTTIETQDGVTRTTKVTPDPTWGSAAAYPSDVTIAVPGTTLHATRAKTLPSSSVIRDDLVVNSALQPFRTEFTSAQGVSPAQYAFKSPLGRLQTVKLQQVTAQVPLPRPETVTVPGLLDVSVAYDRGRPQRVAQGTFAQAGRVVFDRTFYPFGDPLGSVPANSGYVKDTRSGALAFDGSVLAKLASTQNTDASGRPVSAVLDGNTTAFGWDGTGALTALTPPGRDTHRFLYQPAITTYSPPYATGMTAMETYVRYDQDGAVDFIQRPDGQTADFVYDAAKGQLTQIIGSGTNGTITLGYNPAITCAAGQDFCTCTTTGCAPGRLANMTGPSNVKLTFQYKGFLPSRETTVKTGTETVATAQLDWDYDANLRLAGEKLTVATTARGHAAFGYDADGMVTCVENNVTTCARTDTGAERLNYGDTTVTPGLLTDTHLGSIDDTYTYNAFGELASYKAISGAQVLYDVQYDDGDTYRRDSLGRVARMTDRITGRATDYVYDDSGRLKSVSLTVNNVTTLLRSYTYDANGNRHLSGATEVYDEQDRLTSFNGTVYKYNDAGDLTSKTTGGDATAYTYDVFGNLRSVVLTGSVAKTIDYVVDGRGRRVGKKVGGVLIAQYVYADDLRIVAELDGTGVLRSRFLYGSRRNVPDYMERYGSSGASLGLFRILSDQLGSPIRVVDVGTGAVSMDATYDEWGNVTYTSGQGVIPFGFAGGLYDGDTKLVRFGARDYDPQVGRWTTKDPILFRGGQQNLYLYAFGDPVNAVDPAGKAGAFGFCSATGETPGPVQVGVETTGLAGWDSKKSWYHGAIGAIGAHVGGFINHGGIFHGREQVSDGSVEAISLIDGSVGLEIPWLGGVGIGVGAFFTDQDNGFFLFLSGGAIGGYGSIGGGVSW